MADLPPSTSRQPEPAPRPEEPGADGVDWSVCTWKGSRLAQHRAFLGLSFREKMVALEGAADLSRQLLENCRREGRPYRDPYTGEIVRPARPESAAAAPGDGRHPAKQIDLGERAAVG